MTDNTSMTFRLPADLQAAFAAACKANDRTAAQELRAFIRDYVARSALQLPPESSDG